FLLALATPSSAPRRPLARLVPLLARDIMLGLAQPHPRRRAGRRVVDDGRAGRVEGLPQHVPQLVAAAPGRLRRGLLRRAAPAPGGLAPARRGGARGPAARHPAQRLLLLGLLLLLLLGELVVALLDLLPVQPALLGAGLPILPLVRHPDLVLLRLLQLVAV